MTDQTQVDAPQAGAMMTLEPGIRRILAPNPSPMTYWGTNTYVLGTGDVAVLDPGPENRTHLMAILEALEPGERVTHILVTHAHLDHSPLARPLADLTGAQVYAFGEAQAGRSEVMKDLVARGLHSGGEGVDAGFTPDICLAHGDQLTVGGLTVETLWTPGHFANHISFATTGNTGGAVFTGDHVMGWASSLVSPPDGDLTAFMASCEMLRTRKDRVYYPGHGAPVEDPAERINWLIHHRKSREADILNALDPTRPRTIADLTRSIYTDTPPALLPAAERNVFAHLIDLTTRDLVGHEGALSADTNFFRRI
ncbi:MBL fold metallo-hydrolase [Aliiroseovarius crassostreae]|uniref:MBL fold metallo-hydrolase n=1 Tax=Aliiroseovarius crassostreae TaxID=154981 RepID=UPI002201BFD0|nr:MBL fold metallo-hydrolase [Aliiroseovarius crassostreae]UWQ09117.1 MBL fold metallo-hydrolase [Aliiroseovarius crassostreae]UWQ12194.1 MBL fold metallo-hydrolase [Aliiroseovarius crassostreae]